MNLSDQFSQQRQGMIAEAAYFRAQHRGFEGGDPTQDWLEAEAEIDQLLAAGREAESSSLLDQAGKRLQEWDADFARLAERARGASDEVRADLERELERLRPLRANAAKALEDVRQRGEQAWGELGKLTDRARTELSDALERLAARLR